MRAELLDVGGDDPHQRLVWRCPACQCDHGVPVGSHPKAWQWNGSVQLPTLSPSVKIAYHMRDAGLPGSPAAFCHCFVQDGHINFCTDSSHALAGQTVEIPDRE